MAKVKSRLQMRLCNRRSGESRSEYENPLEGNLRAGSIPAPGTILNTLNINLICVIGNNLPYLVEFARLPK